MNFLSFIIHLLHFVNLARAIDVWFNHLYGKAFHCLFPLEVFWPDLSCRATAGVLGNTLFFSSTKMNKVSVDGRCWR
jgi:hypothetical protein